MTPKRRTVRCHCNVSSEGSKPGNEFVEVGSHHGLTTRQTNAVYTERIDHDPGYLFDFLEGQDLGPVKPFEAFFWHAVRASKIAAVRDTDA